jgi:hypothetical protein
MWVACWVARVGSQGCEGNLVGVFVDADRTEKSLTAFRYEGTFAHSTETE